MIGDDAGEVSPLSFSILHAENGGKDVRPYLDQLHSLGAEAGRWFCSFLNPTGTRAAQSLSEARERAPRIAQYLKDRRMFGHAVGWCDTASWVPSDQDPWPLFNEHADWFGDFLKAHPWIIGEVINERDHGSQYRFSQSQVESLVSRIRARGYTGPLTSGAMEGQDELQPDHDGTYAPAGVRGSDLISTHFQRGDEPAWDNANHGFSELYYIADKYNKARLSGEPQRTDDGVWPVGVFPALLGVESQGFNTWSTLHSSQMRDCQILTGQQLADAQLYLRFGKALPRGRYHYENARWQNSPVAGAAFVEGSSTQPGALNVWRAHSFAHHATGQWYLVVYGPNAREPFLEMKNGFALPSPSDLVDALEPYVYVYRIYQR